MIIPSTVPETVNGCFLLIRVVFKPLQSLSRFTMCDGAGSADAPRRNGPF